MQLATCLTVNRMSRRDVDLAIAWAASEGWNPGLADAEPFFTADPKGFFLADYAGQPAGSVSAVAYECIKFSARLAARTCSAAR